jgi:[acyl-carrier-protein] S-malonyltransferase
MKDAIYVFSGQGAQSSGMGKDIYEISESARLIYDKADEALGWSVKELCFEGPDEKLTESRYCQPAIYTTSIACLAAFNELYDNIRPLGTGGLSLGEFAALCAAEVFSFEEGLKLVAERGKLMDEACRETDGGMASILGGNIEIINSVCEECDVDVANFNCPGQIVISGEKEKIKNAVAMLKEKGIKRVIPLKVAGAFHSRLMQSAADKFKTVLDKVDFKAPAIKTAQNFPGTLVKTPEEIKENLYRQVSGSVQWDSCVQALVEATGARRIIEFGSGNVLTGLIKRIKVNVTTYNVNSAETLKNF